jgi:probable HAF family extracellular repeat protein
MNRFAFLLLAAWLPLAALAQAPRYAVVPLHVRPSASTLALPINSLGNIAGTVDTPDGRRAFFYDGSLHLLGPAGTESVAADINAANQVAATLYPAGALARAAILTRSGTQDLGNLGGSILATGINDAGVVVGNAQIPQEPTQDHIFAYAGGALRDLGRFGDLQARAYDVNNAQVVLGTAFPEHPRTFLTDPAGGVDLPVEPGGETILNDHNDMAGTNGIGAFLYHAGVITQAGVPDWSFAFGMNNHDWIVGGAAAEPSRGFLWDGSQWHYINDLLTDPDWFVSYGWGINDAGQISAGGTNLATGEYSALLLTPVTEPAAAAMLVAGLVALAWRRPHG